MDKIPSAEVLFSQMTLLCIKLTRTKQHNVVYSGDSEVYSNVLGTFAHFLKVSALVFSISGTKCLSLDYSYLYGMLIEHQLLLESSSFRVGPSSLFNLLSKMTLLMGQNEKKKMTAMFNTKLAP